MTSASPQTGTAAVGRFLYVVVFISGMTSLAIELTASRLLAPFFGTSTLIWANLIGLILVYLTIGYYLGGQWADRNPNPAVLYQITAWAAFLTGLVPFVATPILNFSRYGLNNVDLGIFVGSFLAIVILFMPAMILLGCVSPFTIRLASRSVESTGVTAGAIYALSTLGSIVGTFLPVLVLIPEVGTRLTFLLLALTLLLLSLVGLTLLDSPRRWLALAMLAILVLLRLLIPEGLVRADEGVIHEKESLYNYIQVVKRGPATYLVLNEGRAVHSIYNPENLLTYGPWDYYLVAPYFNANLDESQVQSLYMVGLGAGTVPKQFTTIYGPIRIEGAEIDPEIIAIGRRYFAMNEPNLRAIPEDGRTYLQRSTQRYDVIGMDAYRQPYIPFHLTTKEFFQEVRDHLTENGVAVVNAGRTPKDDRLVNVLASTMKAVYPNVYVIRLPYTEYNDIVVATNRPTRLENFAANATRLRHPILREVAEGALKGGIREVTTSTVVFTDDRAPVEQVIDQIILDFAVGN